jgi:hypothetical protein
VAVSAAGSVYLAYVRPQDRPGIPLLLTGLWLAIKDTAPDAKDGLAAPTEIGSRRCSIIDVLPGRTPHTVVWDNVFT